MLLLGCCFFLVIHGKCSVPRPPESDLSLVSDFTLTYDQGQIALYRCDDDYSYVKVTCDVSGSWSEPNRHCGGEIQVTLPFINTVYRVFFACVLFSRFSRFLKKNRQFKKRQNSREQNQQSESRAYMAD